MKKIILLTMSFVAMLMIACSNSTPTFEVEVEKYLGYDDTIGAHKVIAITQGGEKIESIIDESLLYNQKIPFKSSMDKSEDLIFGLIRDTHDIITFEVIISKYLGYDDIIAAHKVIAITKSGMPVEAIIPEETLFKNKVPYKGKMKKDEIDRYGYILS